MSLTTFKVNIGGLEATLQSSKSAYVKVNFDRFKTYETDVEKGLSVSWTKDTDQVEFTYETRYSDRLGDKELLLQVYDKGFLGSSLIGSTTIDLYTIATGPHHHELPLLDGARVAGQLKVNVTMEQQSQVVVNVKDFCLACPSVPARSDVEIKYAYTGHEDIVGNQLSLPKGAVTAPYCDRMFVQTTLEDMWKYGLQFWVVVGGNVVADALIPFHSVWTYVKADAKPFNVPLHGRFQGTVSGEMYFENFPEFCQMNGGMHTPTGIRGAVEFPWGVGRPNKPTVKVDGATSAGSGAAAGAGGGAAYAPASVGSHHTAPHASGYGRAPPPSGSAYAPASVAAYPTHGHVAPSYGPGSAYTAPTGSGAGSAPPSSALGAAGRSLLVAGVGSDGSMADCLPAVWSRKVDGSGRVYFQNHATKQTAWDLPTLETYDVTFRAAGSFGMGLEPNGPTSVSFGVPDASPDNVTEWGATVNDVVAGGSAASLDVKVGHRIAAVNGTPTTGVPYSETLALLRAAPRPCVLRFRDPFAVSKSVASYCKTASNPLNEKRFHRPDPTAALSVPAMPSPAPSPGRSPARAMYPTHHTAPAPAPAAFNPAEWQTHTDQAGRPFYFNPRTGQSSYAWPPV